jgi:hypothetical protein
MCNSDSEKPKIECDAGCWKKKRDDAFFQQTSTKAVFKENREKIRFDYYPEEQLSWAIENPEAAKKIEDSLTYIVLNKSTKSWTHLFGDRRNFLQLLVFEHFFLDMITYGGQGQKKTTDVRYTVGAKVPEIMCSEIAGLINRGIHEVRKEADKKTIFEASLIVTNVGLMTTIDTLKKFLANFKNEMYTEKGKNKTQFQVHFYSLARAKEALSYC